MNAIEFILFLPIALTFALLLIGSYFLTLHHRRRNLNAAGTAPANFPPDPFMPIGSLYTGNNLGLTATMPITVFFTAPISGLYLVAAALQVVATNGAGTLAMVLTTPTAGTVAVGAAVGTGAILVPPVLATPTDGYMAAIPIWMNAGATVSLTVTAAGLTGTTYNAFLTALRAL